MAEWGNIGPLQDLISVHVIGWKWKPAGTEGGGGGRRRIASSAMVTVPATVEWALGVPTAECSLHAYCSRKLYFMEQRTN